MYLPDEILRRGTQVIGNEEIYNTGRGKARCSLVAGTTRSFPAAEAIGSSSKCELGRGDGFLFIIFFFYFLFFLFFPFSLFFPFLFFLKKKKYSGNTVDGGGFPR